MRDFKFRAFDKRLNKMVFTGFHLIGEVTAFNGMHEWIMEHMAETPEAETSLDRWDDFVYMQWTGHTDSNNKDVYEGDVHREEIEFDTGDELYYFVCVWIQEWSIFAWLSVTDGEYQKYLVEGADSLDETMFWTYNIERANKITVCGNIYEHPHLLEK